MLRWCLIDMYCKCKRVEVGRIVFENMAYRNLGCWQMILGNCFRGNPEDGLNLFSEMLGRTKYKDWETIPEKRLSGLDEGRGGILPDEITFHRCSLRLRPCWIVKRCQRLLQPND